MLLGLGHEFNKIYFYCTILGPPFLLIFVGCILFHYVIKQNKKKMFSVAEVLNLDSDGYQESRLETSVLSVFIDGPLLQGRKKKN